MHAGRRAHAFLDELVEGGAGGALREERQHDVPAVAVRESLVGCELRGMTAEAALQIVLGRRQLVAGDGHHVLVGVGEDVLVEVVADAGSMGEQMLHGDAIVDQREVTAEQRSRRRVEADLVALDHRHERQGRQPLRSTGDAELRLRRIRNAEPAVGHPGRTLERDDSGAVDAHRSREPFVGHDPFDRFPEPVRFAVDVLHTVQRSTPCACGRRRFRDAHAPFARRCAPSMWKGRQR